MTEAEKIFSRFPDFIREFIYSHGWNELRTVQVEAAKIILKALGIRESGIEVVSCPTCARCKINLIPIAKEVNEKLENCNKKLKVAVMGCVVNGPGEARDADIGIAGGDGCAMLFKKGEIVGKIPEDKIVETLLSEIEKMKG